MWHKRKTQGDPEGEVVCLTIIRIILKIKKFQLILQLKLLTERIFLAGDVTF